MTKGVWKKQPKTMFSLSLSRLYWNIRKVKLMLRKLQTSLERREELCVSLKSWSGVDHVDPSLVPRGQSSLNTIAAELAQPRKWSQELPAQLRGAPCSSLLPSFLPSSTNPGPEGGDSHFGSINIGPAPTLSTVHARSFNPHSTTPPS